MSPVRLDARSLAVPRLFVAVCPPDAILDRVAALARPAIPGVRWTSRDQWHVTLRFLGQVSDAEPIVTALDELEALPPVHATLGPATDRFGQRVVHVPVSGVDVLAAAVVGATAHLGRPPDDRPFSGHLTLARAKPGSRADLRTLVGAPVRGEWVVDDVCLFESRLSPSGARYEALATFTLGAGAPPPPKPNR